MNALSSCNCFSKWSSEVYALLRAVVGFVFLYHGVAKMKMGMENVAGFFAGAGIPLPELSAYLVTYGEVLGGIALIVGFLTHWVAKLNIIIMLGAIGFIHLSNGFNGMDGGYEYQLLLLVVNILFLTMGAGKYSLDAKCKKTE